jgi:hypothetical protein
VVRCWSAGRCDEIARRSISSFCLRSDALGQVEWGRAKLVAALALEFGTKSGEIVIG